MSTNALHVGPNTAFSHHEKRKRNKTKKHERDASSTALVGCLFTHRYGLGKPPNKGKNQHGKHNMNSKDKVDPVLTDERWKPEKYSDGQGNRRCYPKRI